MYTDADLDAAIKGGAMTADAAEAFRGFMAASRSASGADEESFKLLTGFNDIFVTIAVLLVLLATAWLLSGLAWLAAPLTAAASWGLAEYFTRRRRMALPSIVLLLCFVGATFFSALLLAGPAFNPGGPVNPWDLGSPFGVSALVAAAAAFAHWRRFKVPVTVAVGVSAATASALSALVWALPALRQAPSLLVFVAGLGVFALAMWWDASDRLRVTRRSDTAFWLHLLAAPMIVQPIFLMLGLLSATVRPETALVAVTCYVLLGVVALVVDRRAILVSALSYVLWAMASLLSSMGALSSAFALAALGIGGCLLLLSVFWRSIRRLVLPYVSAWIRNRVPSA